MIITKIVHILVSVSLLLFGLNTQAASDACFYNPDSISPERYLKNDALKHLQWDEYTKTAHMQTVHGELLTIKHWACVHFGIEAELTVKRPQKGDEQEDVFLRRKIDWLSQLILDSADQKRLNEAMLREQFKSQMNRMIAGSSDEIILFTSGDYYAQIALHLVTEKDNVVINLHVELD